MGALVAGALLAVVASLLRRGKSGMPWWGNWLAGIGGAVMGFYIAEALGVAATSGVDWIRWAISIAVAVFLLGIGGRFIHKR
ncbi:MAG: GlsB/YeaQ/YmgE family stress response membrane protein, partial [Actinobacteria bacterium HGW-Actinobacteria-8]